MIRLSGRKVGITAVAFSPDGRRLAAACEQARIQLWDLKAAKLERAFVLGDGNRGSSEGILFLPDGTRLLANDYLRLRAATLEGRSLALQGPRIDVLAFAAAEQRQALAFAHPSSVVLYGLPAFDVMWRVSAPNRATALACTPDGQTVVLAQSREGIRLYRASGEALPRLPVGRKRVKALAISPDGSAVAGCAQAELRLWRLTPEAREVKRVELGRTHFLSVAWHPSGAFFATGNGDGKVDYWDAQTGERRESFDWGVGKVRALAFDRSGDRAACGSHVGDAVVWDVDV
jgi:WD40 repeat protein